MSTTINITLDTKNIYLVQAFVSAMGSILMNATYDHEIVISEPIFTEATDTAEV